MSVLVLSDERDPTADLVVEALGCRGARVDRLDLGWFPGRLDLDAELGAQGWTGVLRAGHRDVTLDGVRAVFYRSPTGFTFPPELAGPQLRHARMEAKLGLPRSLVTNRADAVHRFAAEVGGPIVVKPLGYASMVDAGVRRALYTRVLTGDDLTDLRGVELTAHLFQRYIEDKAYELRLTVVGNGEDARVFPAAIHAGSAASRVDFRADYESLSYRVVDIPDDVRAGVCVFMRAFGITLGHFDFCVDESGQHWFLECNGSGGQYQFVEKATGLPITDAIADLLWTGTP